MANAAKRLARTHKAFIEKQHMFFVATGDGGHAFAETLDEHNENVARLRAREAEARDN